jgi:hypothetical protein
VLERTADDRHDSVRDSHQTIDLSGWTLRLPCDLVVDTIPVGMRQVSTGNYAARLKMIQTIRKLSYTII